MMYKTDYLEGRKERPFTPRHRLFANTSYETHLHDDGKQWKFDATTTGWGHSDTPSTEASP